MNQRPGNVNKGPGTVNQRPAAGTVNQRPGTVNQGPGTVNQRPAAGTVNQRPGSVNQGPGTVNQGPGTVNQAARGMVKAVSAPMVSRSPQTTARNQTLPNVQATTPSTRPPTFTWQKGSFSLEHILKNFPLPRVIQCDHTQCDAQRLRDGFDCSQPLLLYSSLVSLKVSAVGLAVNIKDGKSLVETDSRLLVSEDYKGWFAVLGSDMTQKTIPHYRRVAQLSQSDCHTFLVGGFDNVKTLQKVGDSISEGRQLCPGDVLKMGVIKDGNKYLHCTDDRDRDVLLPLDGVGVFLVISHKTKASRTPVLQIKDIIGKYKLPCNVKLVYGREPADAGVFTRFMVLDGVREHTSLLAATILKQRSTLHDLPVNIQKRFRVAVPSPDLPRSAGYASALSLCVDSGDRFMRGIRLFKKDTEVRPNQKTNNTKIPSQSEVAITGNAKPLSSAVKDLHSSAKPPTVIDTRQHGVDTISPTSPLSKAKTGEVSGSNGNTTPVKAKPSMNSSSAAPSTAVRPNAYEKVWSASSSRASHVSSPAPVQTQQSMDGQLVKGKVYVDSKSQNASSKPPGVTNGSGVVTPTSPRPKDYEQVWSGSSRTSSDAPSPAPAVTHRGIGGQVITGGIDVDSNSQTISPKMHPVISKSNSFTYTVGTTAITDTITPKPCKTGVQEIDNPTACKGAHTTRLSFQTNINVANNSQQVLSNDGHSTPEVDPSLKKKKVSFATNIDVHTDAKHNAARLVVSELTQKHIHFNDGDIPRPEHSTGKVVSFEEFSPDYVAEHEVPILMPRATRVPDSGEDEEGYMVPVLDRKGRVKSMHHHSHKKEARTKESLAKMISLPKMSYCTEEPLGSDTERHLLY